MFEELFLHSSLYVVIPNGGPKSNPLHSLRVHRRDHAKHPIETIAFMTMKGLADRFVVISIQRRRGRPNKGVVSIQGAAATVGIEVGIPVVPLVQMNPGFAGSTDKMDSLTCRQRPRVCLRIKIRMRS